MGKVYISGPFTHSHVHVSEIYCKDFLYLVVETVLNLVQVDEMIL